MIFCREFASIHEIDPEFIPSIESLLEGTVPDFKFLEIEEKNKKDHQYFIYHLFFGPKTNRPIGFAKAVVNIDKEVKPNFFNRILGKDGLEKSVEWTISKDNYSGFVFDPTYIESVKDASMNAIKKIFKGNEVQTQKLYFDPLIQQTFPKDKNIVQTKVMPDALLKNKNTYHDYIASLKPEVRKEVKKSWKMLYQDPELKMGDYQNFKEAFEYKELGISQYNEYKKHEVTLKYKDVNCHKEFLTIENDYEVLAMVIYSQGQNQHHFFEILFGRDHFSEAQLSQLAILKFYELSSARYLHAINIEDTNCLSQYDFQMKKQLSVHTYQDSYDPSKLH